MADKLFKITHRFSGAVLFKLRCGSQKLCVEAAVKSGADLGGAFLGGASLRGAYLGGASLGGADLGGAFLRGAFLRGASLRGAYLGGASLGGADLGGASLGGADLGGAFLRGASLRGADLGRASLGGAYLGGASLGGADLGGHKVDGRFGLIQAGIPNNWSAFGFISETGELRVCVGCKSFSLAKGRTYWGPTHRSPNERREVLAALDYIEAIAKLRGWSAVRSDAEAA